MNGKQGPPKGFFHEVNLILKRARQVWKLVPRRHKAAFGFAALVMGVTSACNTAIPLLLGTLVNKIQQATEQHVGQPGLYRLAAFFLSIIAVTYLVRELSQVARRYLVENSCTRIEKVMTVKLVSHLMKVDLAVLGAEKVGALNGRISRSVVGFVRFLRLAFLDFFPPFVTGLFALVTTVYKEPWLAVAMAGVIPASLYQTVRQLTSQKGIRLALIRSREVMDGTVVEQLSGIDYVRACNSHEYEVERVARAAEKRRAKEIRHHFRMSLFGCGKALTEGFFHILVISLAIYLSLQGRFEPGYVLTFSLLFLNIMAPLSEVHRALDEGHECSLQVADLLEMLAEPADRSFSPDRTEEPKLIDRSPAITTENLRVEYTTAAGERKLALDGVSLEIRHGETVGVAGRSGCGKTTWLRVLMRLTHPTGGQARLGGVPIEAVSRESIGRLIGYVGQSPFVFAGTIAENIAYGAKEASPDDVRRAAELACIHDEIVAMPGGYEAPVTERGANLSGGQRQRLALARVFLKNPPILILDEGTSALDTISERNVQRAITAAREDRTVILVAHRLSTLLDCDRIFVVDNGQVVETGTYTDLLHRGGVFAELARHGANGQEALDSPEPVDHHEGELVRAQS